MAKQQNTYMLTVPERDEDVKLGKGYTQTFSVGERFLVQVKRPRHANCESLLTVFDCAVNAWVGSQALTEILGVEDPFCGDIGTAILLAHASACEATELLAALKGMSDDQWFFSETEYVLMVDENADGIAHNPKGAERFHKRRKRMVVAIASTTYGDNSINA